MRTLRYVLMVAAVMCGLLTAKAQILPTSGFHNLYVEAGAFNGIENDDPPAIDFTDTTNISVFSTNVGISAAVSDANASAGARQSSDIQPYSITATGRVFAIATSSAAGASAGAEAAILLTIQFDLTNQHAYAMSGVLFGSVSTGGSLLAQIVLDSYTTLSNVYTRSLPEDAGAFSTRGVLPSGSYKLMVEYKLLPATASAESGSTSGEADFRLLFQVAPPPEFTAVACETNGIRTTWTSVSGVVYQVQSTDLLLVPSWTNGPTVLATNGTASAFDTNPLPASRFYRVLPFP
jgi:hypothetical protein